MAKASLTGTDLFRWIALRRVFEGEVTRLSDCWHDHGHRVPGYVTGALDELLGEGLVMLADPDPMAQGAIPVALTDVGAVRFKYLCETAE
jgi:hypothetical protein